MNTKNFKLLSVSVIAATLTITSCIKDLDTIPIDPDVVTSATVYKDAEAYRMVLAKCYAGLSVSGQQGAAGMPDISGIDEGFSQYMRQLWLAQELTTDEAVMNWNDGTVKTYHSQTWTPSGEFIGAMYNRIYYQVALCNEFIRESSDAKLDDRGITGNDKTTVQTYRAEARFLRALSYYHAIDMYGNVPFVTEKDAVGSFMPKQISRSDLFNYIESELLEIENDLLAPKSVYGRADKAAAWMLLARLYLNGKVYTGTDHYTDCITQVKKVIALAPATYSLTANYSNLFKADNNTSNEIIFAATFDGIHTKTWGGTTYLIHAQVGGSMIDSDYGISGGWGGIRTTSALVNKFPDLAADKRAMFHTDGQTLEIADVGVFTQGYAIKKWSNQKSTGGAGQDGTFTDTDFPIFRLADAYLMYAESVIKGGTGGNTTDALTYVNLVRARAFGNTSGNLSSASEITSDFIIDERAREFFWEALRRTDLIRFGRFSESTYLWPWKGGLAAGISTDKHLNLFPIPSSDIGANTNLIQNDKY